MNLLADPAVTGRETGAGPMRGGFGMVSVCTDKAMMVVMHGDKGNAGDEGMQVA